MNPGWRKNYLRYKTYFLNVVARSKERADIRAYLELLLSLATISVFSIFALRPTILTIAQLIKEIETKKETLAQMEGKIQNISKAQSLYDRERVKINLISQAVPVRPNPEIFTRQIQGLSQTNQTSILGVSTEEALILGQDKPNLNRETEVTEEKDKPVTGADELKFSFQNSVDLEQYRSISNFLVEFEKLRLPAKIDSLSLGSSQTKEEKSLTLIVEGSLPYLKKGN